MSLFLTLSSAYDICSTWNKMWRSYLSFSCPGLWGFKNIPRLATTPHIWFEQCKYSFHTCPLQNVLCILLARKVVTWQELSLWQVYLDLYLVSPARLLLICSLGWIVTDFLGLAMFRYCLLCRLPLDVLFFYWFQPACLPPSPGKHQFDLLILVVFFCWLLWLTLFFPNWTWGADSYQVFV